MCYQLFYAADSGESGPNMTKSYIRDSSGRTCDRADLNLSPQARRHVDSRISLNCRAPIGDRISRYC